MNSSQQTHSEAEDQIDIIALLSKVWVGRKFIIKSAVIAAVIGVLVAISYSKYVYSFFHVYTKL